MNNIEQHLHIVARNLNYFRSRSLPPSIDLDDLYQAGVLGLMHAMGTYDGRNDCSFDSHVCHRIYGAMWDEIRDAKSGTRKGETIVRSESSHTIAVQNFQDGSKSTHDSCASEREVMDLSKAVETLRDRDRAAVHLYYTDGFSLAEVGQVFGFGEARACQILSAVAKTLAVQLEGWA